jgi:hypothetical protein
MSGPSMLLSIVATHSADSQPTCLMVSPLKYVSLSVCTWMCDDWPCMLGMSKRRCSPCKCTTNGLDLQAKGVCVYLRVYECAYVVESAVRIASAPVPC